MIAKDDYIRFCYLPGNWPSQILNRIFYNIFILIEYLVACSGVRRRLYDYDMRSLPREDPIVISLIPLQAFSDIAYERCKEVFCLIVHISL